MASVDDFGIVPHGMFDDLEDLSLPLVAVMTMCMSQANDHGLFEGRVSAFARSVARTRDEIEPLLLALEERNLIVFYDAPTPSGKTVRVGEIVGFFDYRGQAETRTSPSRRRKSALPLRDGSYPAHRGHSGGSEDDAEVSRKQRGSVAEAPRGQAKRSEAKQSEALSPPQGERELHEPPRPVAETQPQPRAADAPLGGAPPEGAERGEERQAAPDGATAIRESGPRRRGLPVADTGSIDPAFVASPLPEEWPRDERGWPRPFGQVKWLALSAAPPDETSAQRRQRLAAVRVVQRVESGYA